MGFPASGREVTTTWIEIFRMENGKAAEGWIESDSATLRNQLVAEPG
jgi:predicted ester cyclase